MKASSADTTAARLPERLPSPVAGAAGPSYGPAPHDVRRPRSRRRGGRRPAQPCNTGGRMRRSADPRRPRHRRTRRCRAGPAPGEPAPARTRWPRWRNLPERLWPACSRLACRASVRLADLTDPERERWTRSPGPARRAAGVVLEPDRQPRALPPRPPDPVRAPAHEDAAGGVLLAVLAGRAADPLQPEPAGLRVARVTPPPGMST